MHRSGANETLLSFLNRTRPDYVELVPDHWLGQSAPDAKEQAAIACYFLVLGLVNNVCFVLVGTVYIR